MTTVNGSSHLEEVSEHQIGFLAGTKIESLTYYRQKNSQISLMRNFFQLFCCGPNVIVKEDKNALHSDVIQWMSFQLWHNYYCTTHRSLFSSRKIDNNSNLVTN